MAKLISKTLNSKIEPLYDIEVNQNHNFVANNIVVKNSEQYLSRDSLCVLSSLNCGKFSPKPKEYEQELSIIGPSINRFLDNVNECELRYGTYATAHQKLAIKSLRRTGAGFTDIAGWLFKNNLVYGTPEGNDAIDAFTERYNYYLYKNSIELGKEKGSFGLFDRAKFEKSPFIQRLIKLGLKFEAMRNVTCSSIAPVGCSTKDTIIRTTTGDFSIEELFKLNGYNFEEILTSQGKFYETNKDLFVFDLLGNRNKITKLYVNRLDGIRKLEFDNGDTLSCTLYHKILVVSKDNPRYAEWKQAEDITEEDEIVVLK